MIIYVDADACPVKPEVYRVAKRHEVKVTLVTASQMKPPEESFVTLEIVAQGIDAADDWIVERVKARDIVITGDIPLAARCIEKLACVIGFTGKPFTPENIGLALATRNILSTLRDAGEMIGGPPPFSKKDRSRFLQELDKVLHKIKREGTEAL